MKKFLILALTASSMNVTHAAPKSTVNKAPSFAPPTQATILTDGWYTMQAGSTPWGYYHEYIEQRSDGRYAYRYLMTKVENKQVYEENIGAICESDLTPVTFNLNKSGTGALESTNATYSKGPNGTGIMSIQVAGAQSTSFKRAIAGSTILDVFFPLWLKKNWDKMKPGYSGRVKTFAEDPQKRDFRSRDVRFQVVGQNNALGCTDLRVELDSQVFRWCTKSDGALIDLKTGSYHVQKVSGEKAARDFLSGVLPKSK